MPPPAIAHTTGELRDVVASWRNAGERVGLVPTMGALHPGHLSLARLARGESGRVVVSIFVNPAQFAPDEDFSKYPRTFEEDCRSLSGEADLVFAPSVGDMYPPGSATTVSLAGPAAAGLEDRFRPTHFQGVATVVAKLLIQALADIAVFGEKDYQQLKVVARMAEDLFIPTRIVAGPTVREADGLALSSRNRYLSAPERARAPALFAALQGCADRIRAGESVEGAVAEAAARLEREGFGVDYLEARHAETLAPGASGQGPLRLLAAARLGAVRLIDNLAV